MSSGSSFPKSSSIIITKLFGKQVIGLKGEELQLCIWQMFCGDTSSMTLTLYLLYSITTTFPSDPETVYKKLSSSIDITLSSSTISYDPSAKNISNITSSW